jgi:hypothetical protein
MSCFQCDLDIPHVCYEGVPRARWGWGDEAVALLESAQRHGFVRSSQPRTKRAAKKRGSR